MPIDSSAHLSPDERLNEIAAILAAGFLRLMRRTGCVPPAPAPTVGESADGSKTPVDSPCHLSETSAQCPSR